MIAELKLWEQGTHPDQPCESCKYFWEWSGGPPNDESYRSRKWDNNEATHYQMYETVSEGTPVSPVFATLTELEDYLVNNGDFSDQRFGNGGWSREAAHGFCSRGSAPSMMADTRKGIIAEPRDAAMYREAE